MREHIEADEPFVREDVPVADRAGALPRRGPGLQGRADRGPRPRHTASRRSASTPTARSPTSAAARTRRRPSASAPSSCSRSPAPTGAATPTARCSPASTAPRSSRRRSSRSTSSCSSRPARATTASSAASSGCSVLRDLARLAVLAAQGHGQVWNELDRAVARRERATAATARSRRRSSTTSSCGRPRGHWDKYRDNMFFTDVEDRRMGLKPMNCPGHCQLFKDAAALLPRPARSATASRASCTATSRRGDAARPAARPPHHPGRRPHLLHRGADRRTRSCAAWTSAFATYDAVRLRAALELSTRPEKRIGADEMWDRAEARAASSALDAQRPRVRDQRGRRRVLRPEDRPAHRRDSLGRSWQLGTVQLDYSTARALRPDLHRRRQRRAPRR